MKQILRELRTLPERVCFGTLIAVTLLGVVAVLAMAF